MTKYLMIDHGGVIDAKVDMKRPGPNDMLIEAFDWGGYQYLPEATSIIKMLNRLVDDFGYKLVYHSKNIEADQLVIHEKLQLFCRSKGLKMPKFTAMAVRDKEKYVGISSSHCKIIRERDHGIAIAAYGVEADRKHCVRTALQRLLGDVDVKGSIVFDDGPTVVSAAQKEGFKAIQVDEKNPLHKQLEHYLQKEERNKRSLASTDIDAARSSEKSPFSGGGGGGGGGGEDGGGDARAIVPSGTMQVLFKLFNSKSLFIDVPKKMSYREFAVRLNMQLRGSPDQVRLFHEGKQFETLPNIKMADTNKSTCLHMIFESDNTKECVFQAIEQITKKATVVDPKSPVVDKVKWDKLRPEQKSMISENSYDVRRSKVTPSEYWELLSGSEQQAQLKEMTSSKSTTISEASSSGGTAGFVSSADPKPIKWEDLDDSKKSNISIATRTDRYSFGGISTGNYWNMITVEQQQAILRKIEPDPAAADFSKCSM